jgi:UDP-N-acetylglucosamine 2-epimerase (non-hydrolysing)
MVLTEHARRYLLAEGIRPETIIKTGSHMEEVLEYYMPRIEQSDVLLREGLEAGRYFIVSTHREENVDTPENLSDLLDTLRALADEYCLPIIVSTHPRTRKRLETLGESLEHPLIRFVKPFGLLDYIKLQMSAFCILSDSGTITEEASLLNLPAITLRNAHERPEGMDEGVLIMTGLKRQPVLDAIKVVVSQHDRTRRVIPVVPDYQAGPVSKQVVRIVLSYTDYINRTVWRKF